LYIRNNVKLTVVHKTLIWPQVGHSCWCRDILQWWSEHRLELPALSDLAINMSNMMATSVANEQVFVVSMIMS